MRREAELALDRARKLRTNNTVAQATVDELEAAYAGTSARLDGAERRLADRTIRAPFAVSSASARLDLGARVDDEPSSPPSTISPRSRSSSACRRPSTARSSSASR